MSCIQNLLYFIVFYWFVSLFFFFKQKTAYEMRISDWSSDVCSSDLGVGCAGQVHVVEDRFLAGDREGIRHTHSRRYGRVDPAGEGRQPFGYGQGIIIHDIVRSRFGRDRRHGRRYRVVYMDERPDPRAIADDRRHALADLLRARAVWTIPGARPIEESIAQHDTL